MQAALVSLWFIIAVSAAQTGSIAVGDSSLPMLSIGSETPVYFVVRTLGDQRYFLRDECGPPRRRQKLISRSPRPVVTSFFATYCEPCKEEIPHLERLSQKWGDSVSFLLVDFREPERVVESFVDSIGTSITILIDRYGKAAERFLVNVIPTLVILDHCGYLALYQRGQADDMDSFFADMDRMLEGLVARSRSDQEQALCPWVKN